MAESRQTILSNGLFEEINKRYKDISSFTLAYISDNTVRLNRCPYYPWEKIQSRSLSCDRMISEAVRWGEPNIAVDDDDNFIWCVPVFDNNKTVGGVFSTNFRNGMLSDNELGSNVREAAWKLLELAEDFNICNSSLMQMNRMTAQINAKRAEAIHQSKHFYYQNPRDIYLIEERQLIDSIRHRNIELAREIINRILVGVYQVGNRSFDVLKPLALEIVVQMHRAAVEEGANPTELLGVNSVFLVDFLNTENEYELNKWLSNWLEIFVNATFSAERRSTPRTLSPALLYIKSNLDKPITRDHVATICNLSPGHFSRLFKNGTGYSFSALLNRFRIEHACNLLKNTSMSASEVALASGYNDQSYFVKVFKKVMGVTPGKYMKASL